LASPAYQLPTILRTPNQVLIKAHLKSLNLSYFKTVEAAKNYRIEDPLDGIISTTIFMKLYHAVQATSIDTLYQKTGKPIGRFCPTEYNLVTMVIMVALVTMTTLAKDGM
jgi:hypothetical protein